MDPEIIIAIVSAAIALAGAVVAYYAFHRTLRSSARPVLIFSMTSDFLWRVENVGTGPAINLVILDTDSKGLFASVTNCYPLAVGASLDLIWIDACWKLGAVYTDVYGDTFTTICQGNRNRVVNRNEFPQWKPDRDQWLQLILAEGKHQSQLTTEHLAEKTASELEIMRNQIYARRGFIFKREDLAKYFREQSWYVPATRDYALIHRQMTPAERYEAHLILDFQNHNQLRAVPITGSALPDTQHALGGPQPNDGATVDREPGIFPPQD
jgi:hypothetical protein